MNDSQYPPVMRCTACGFILAETGGGYAHTMAMYPPHDPVPEPVPELSAPVPWTSAEVTQAVQAGARLVLNDPGISVSDPGHDLVNLVVSAILVLLDSPGASLDEVIDQSYDTRRACEDDECDHSRCARGIVRSWLDGA